MRTMMMSDVQFIDSLASEDGHSASISEKHWVDTAPNDQHGEVDEAVAKLGEVLRETLRELGGVGQEVDKLQLEIAEFRTALAKLRGWVGEQRRWDLAMQ
jgi:hypothetical protein